MEKTLKILVARFSSIGDIVLCSPIVRCLKEQLSSEVHFITKDKYKDIIETNPYIDKVYSIQNSTSEVFKSLKKENYDYLIDLHKNIRTFQLIKFATNYLSYNKQNFMKFLFIKFGINLINDKHIVDRYFESIRNLRVKNDGKGLDFFLDDCDIVDLNCFDSNYITFAIGGTHFTKILPIDKIIEICNIQDKQLVLIGGKEDYKRGEIIRSQCKNVINECGKHTIKQSAYIVKNSNFLITHDTGMMHIASAFGIKIISVFGGTHPKLGFAPYLPNSENKIIQIENLKCRPCHRFGRSKCPKGHFKCMKNIDVSLFAE